MRVQPFLVGLAVACALAACRSRETTVPDGLIGVWTTEAPKYQDRFFDLRSDKVLFGTGNGNSDSNPIVAIETAEEDGHLLCNIDYLGSEGQEYTFSFYYDPANGGVINLKNQLEIDWQKEGRQQP
jgi:hypothetical protein